MKMPCLLLIFSQSEYYRSRTSVKREKLAMYSKSFPFKVDYFSEGRQNDFDRVASHVSVIVCLLKLLHALMLDTGLKFALS